MKKRLLGLSAFIFAAALVGCGADKEKTADNKKEEDTTAIVTETTDTSIKKDTKKKNNDEDKAESDAKPVSLKDIAGSYHKSGHMYSGKYPDDINDLDQKLKDDPITISEDGILHFAGKDYKLVDEGAKKDIYFFSIEGCGFDLSRSNQSTAYADADYEGPCAFASMTSYMTINDVKYPCESYVIFLKQKGSERSFGYIFMDEGEESETTWSFDWDDDEEVSSEDNITEE